MGFFDFAKKNEFDLIKSLNNTLTSKDKEIKELRNTIQNLALNNQKLKKEFDDLNANYDLSIRLYDELEKKVDKMSDENSFKNIALYEPTFEYDTSKKYRRAILQNRENQKILIKENKAITSKDENYYYKRESNSPYEKLMAGYYIRNIKSYKKILMLAFNSECDALISKVKWHNHESLIDRINSTSEKINSHSSSFCSMLYWLHKENMNLKDAPDITLDLFIVITDQFVKLKIDELQLKYELERKIYDEKEKLRKERELIHEEERAQKEFEKARKDAEKEEKRLIKELSKAQDSLKSDGQSDIHHLEEIIIKLERQLKEITLRKERALSMAQQTRMGHVYIISNTGSFGNDIYKIGMSRRLEPEDRVRELGGASVPFRYDIHGMIFSEDAPSLESELHKSFSTNRVNMFNNRKEFFKIHIDEIKNKLVELGINIKIKKIPEAREFRETQKIIEKIMVEQENYKNSN